MLGRINKILSQPAMLAVSLVEVSFVELSSVALRRLAQEINGVERDLDKEFFRSLGELK